MKLEENRFTHKIKSYFEAKSKDNEKKYKQKLKAISEEANRIYTKQDKLEKKSSKCIEQENLYKKAIKSLTNDLNKEKDVISKLDSDKESYGTYMTLKVENEQLKSELEDLENRVVSYFEELSSMIDTHKEKQIFKAKKKSGVLNLNLAGLS